MPPAALLHAVPVNLDRGADVQGDLVWAQHWCEGAINQLQGWKQLL
jgi:hypothetical protein